ncbi:MAG: serine/threonine-protein kinase [Candidatus Flexifilum sp.]
MAQTSATARLIGRRYLLQEQLGAGNMGTVHRAVDRLTGQMVALKQIKQPTEQLSFGSHSSDADLEMALAQEFKIMASLRHPNIISVLDYGFHVDTALSRRTPYITMELLDGAESFLDFAERLPFDQQIDLLLQMLHALVYLHRRAVLHRDLKPKNVLVVDNTVKVLDFGLSILSEAAKEGEAAGTPSYMAPELWMGRPATRQSDLYAVGMIAFRLFAGQHPFDTSSLQTLFRQVQTLDPDLNLLRTPDPVKGVIGRLLAKDPAARYQDAAEVIDALRQACGRDLPLETPALRESFLQAATFVGRERELALLSQVLHEALAGRGSAWLIAGESGVGKSRLMDELRTRALVQGALVLRGQAANVATSPYALWANAVRWLVLLADIDDRLAAILKFLVPDIDKLRGMAVPDAREAAPQAAQARILRAIETLVHHVAAGGSTATDAVAQPIVLMLEDLHWADSESLTLLARIAHIAPELPLLVIGTYRDDESPDLPVMLSGMRLIKLDRLTPQQTALLTEAMLGPAGRSPELLELLQKETEGNTFFLVESVRALAEESGQLDRVGSAPLPMRVLTGGIQGIIQRRLNRVPEEARAFLKLAAVSGRYPDLDVIAEVLRQQGEPDRVATWLADCADAAVLEVHDGEWRFCHNKLRDAVLLEIPLEQSRTLHRQVAEAVEAVYQYSPKSTAEILAYLWQMAGDPAREEHYAALAGEQAVREGAYRAAQRFLERALELQREVSVKPHKQATIRQQLGDAYFETSQIERARAMYSESLDLFRAGESRWGEGSVIVRLGMVATEQGDFDQAARCFIDALRIASEARAKTVALSALAATATLLARTGEPVTAVQYLALVLQHPSSDAQTVYAAERQLNLLRADLSPEAFAAAVDQGRAMQLNSVIQRILNE